MSTTFPILTKHQLFQSHLVNCKICNKYESASIEEVDIGKWETKTKAKIKRFMCPVGIILFNEALKEDPTKNPFRPKSFPYVAKKWEQVRVRPKGKTKWVQAQVIDLSIGGNGRVTGYEVCITTKSQFEGISDQQDYYYVNSDNIKPLVTWKEKQEALRTKETPIITTPSGKFKINIP